MPFVTVRVTRGYLVVCDRASYTWPFSRCRHPALFGRTLIPLSVSLLNDLDNPVFDGVRLTGFMSRVNAF